MVDDRDGSAADFISRNDGEHVRGTECDQTILSKKGSSGVVYSPNYPYPYIPGISCRYFIYGLQDAQHFERVKLSFDKFDVPDVNYTYVGPIILFIHYGHPMICWWSLSVLCCDFITSLSSWAGFDLFSMTPIYNNIKIYSIIKA